MIVPLSQNNSKQKEDERFMALALSLAWRGLGNTAPNPTVGALIVAGEGDKRTIVGQGWTSPGGRPHGETVALEMAGERARGATLYVTLEPCSHFGKTPPCAQAIIDAGIARVVCALGDPDERVCGRGFKMLEEAGLTVKTGVLENEALWLNLGHILCVCTERPFIQLKLAIGADKLVTQTGAPSPGATSSSAPIASFN